MRPARVVFPSLLTQQVMKITPYQTEVVLFLLFLQFGVPHWQQGGRNLLLENI